MKNRIALMIFAVVLTAPLRAQETASTGPIAIKKWSIGWDRFKRTAILDAVFMNTSGKHVSELNVVLKFFTDKGRMTKQSYPWRKSYLPGRTTTRMKFRIRNCPPFERYHVVMTGTEEEPFEQIFEGKYWPEKPGDTPEMPEPVVFGRGTADVRVTGSRTEYLKIRKGREAMQISGTVQNMGDCPAENVAVTIKMLNGKKAVWTEDVAIKAPLAPGATAPFRVIVNPLPRHTSITYHVNFDSVETGGGSATIGKFDVDAGALLVKDCYLDPKTGLFTGTLINKGEKTLYDVVVNINIEKSGAATSYKIQPGGEVKPGDSLDLIKATPPGFDTFGVDVGFQEK